MQRTHSIVRLVKLPSEGGKVPISLLLSNTLPRAEARECVSTDIAWAALWQTAWAAHAQLHEG
jgi:hypothetical protein